MGSSQRGPSPPEVCLLEEEVTGGLGTGAGAPQMLKSGQSQVGLVGRWDPMGVGQGQLWGCGNTQLYPILWV